MPTQNSSDARRSGSRMVMPPVRCCGDQATVMRRPRVEIAVIHRPRYDDWSLPKGKVDPGETAPVAAVREVREETGQHAILGRRLDSVSYPIEPGVKKSSTGRRAHRRRIQCRATGRTGWLWLPIAEAMQKLDYTQDRKVLRHFTRSRPHPNGTGGPARHGRRKSRFSGDDAKRPLDKRGRAQAKALVPQLLAFGASQVYAADRVRCHQTVEPLAADSDVPVHNEPTLTEEAYAKNAKRGRHRMLDIAKQQGTPVVCTQGKVIPDLIAWWCDRDGVRPDKSRNHKGSTWVLSLSDGRLVAADHIGGALAANVRA